MKKSIRLALLAGACFLGLAVAAPALADYRPSLIMEQTSYKLGAPITADVFLAIPKDDDATAKVTIVSPNGYDANLAQAPGTEIGNVTAQVKAKAAGDAVFTLGGKVIAGDPANSTLQAAALRCTGNAAHAAIWVLNASLQGQTIQIPDYVDKVGPLVTQQVCLPSPDVPPAMGGAVLGAQLFRADFTITHVFTNAGTRGGYEWAAIYTPYVAGPSGAPNPGGTTEARTYVGLPSSLTLKRAKAKKGLKFAGQLTIAGLDPSGVRLGLYAGKKAKPAPNAISGPKGKHVATSAKLPKSGKYTLTRPTVKFATYFQARFENYTTPCTGPSPTGQTIPKGCREERIAAVTSNQLRVVKPKPKKKHHR
jgi:hypothetical protein